MDKMSDPVSHLTDEERASISARMSRVLAQLPSEAHPSCWDLAAELIWLAESEWELIEGAIEMADSAHRGQTRKSGEPYIIHPIEVARAVAKLGLDSEAICAALLHDVAEDTSVGLAEIEERFGKTVASMVDALTKIDAIKMTVAEGKERQAKAETLRKMMLAMSRDVRVILIKLCDRIHNLSTIGALDQFKRRRIAEETMEIYAPIASRLGLNGLWSKLMDLSFKARHPWRSKIIEAEIDRSHAHHRNYVAAAVARVKTALCREGIETEVSGRSKKGYSV